MVNPVQSLERLLQTFEVPIYENFSSMPDQVEDHILMAFDSHEVFYPDQNTNLLRRLLSKSETRWENVPQRLREMWHDLDLHPKDVSFCDILAWNEGECNIKLQGPLCEVLEEFARNRDDSALYALVPPHENVRGTVGIRKAFIATTAQATWETFANSNYSTHSVFLRRYSLKVMQLVVATIKDLQEEAKASEQSDEEEVSGENDPA